jgi:hypothetical protein
VANQQKFRDIFPSNFHRKQKAEASITNVIFKTQAVADKIFKMNDNFIVCFSNKKYEQNV